MSKKSKIVVLFSGPSANIQVIEQTLGDEYIVERYEPEEILVHFHKCDVFLDASMKTRISSEEIGKAKNLKLVVTATTGADHIDGEALNSRSIPLLTLKGQKEILHGFTGAAELSWLLLMACARKIKPAFNHVDEGNWRRVDFPGIMLKGKTLGVVGFGRIGSWMARYAKAFGMRVLAYDPFITEFNDDVEPSQFDELLQNSDFISLHVHLSSETRGLFGVNRIGKIKQGAILINTARGELIDEKALIDSIEQGKIGAYGCDVLTGEPDIKDSLIWQHAQTNSNIVITPHIGGFCPETVEQSLIFSANRIKSYFNNL